MRVEDTFSGSQRSPSHVPGRHRQLLRGIPLHDGEDALQVVPEELLRVPRDSNCIEIWGNTLFFPKFVFTFLYRHRIEGAAMRCRAEAALQGLAISHVSPCGIQV